MTPAYQPQGQMMKPVEQKKEATSKKDKKKEKTMNALFAGVSSTQKESSSDEEERKETKKVVEQPVEQPKPQQSVGDLLSWEAPQTTPTTTSQPTLLDMFATAPVQPVVQELPFKPMQITTQQFGGMWGQNPFERQYTISLPGVSSTADYTA